MKAGIWLDTHKAYLVFLKNGEERMIRMESEVEDFHVSGGSTSSIPFGPHDAVSEKRFLERKKHQLNKYFKSIVNKIKTCEAIYIFGPAEAKKGLKKEIISDASLKTRLEKIETSDAMTENQIVAKVKEFFN